MVIQEVIIEREREKQKVKYESLVWFRGSLTDIDVIT